MARVRNNGDVDSNSHWPESEEMQRSRSLKRSRSMSEDSDDSMTSSKKRPRVDERGTSKIKSRQSSSSSRRFACPFAKHDPVLWGGHQTCGVWRNGDIATVIRHHVIGKHKALNKSLPKGDPRWIDPSHFESVDRWRRQVRLEKKKAAEHWAALYSILFDLDEIEKQSVPSPYFCADSALAAVNEIEVHLRRRALDDPDRGQSEACLLLTKVETRRMQRDRDKSQIRCDFAAKIRELENQRDAALLQVDENCTDDLEELQKSFVQFTTGPRSQFNQYMVQTPPSNQQIGYNEWDEGLCFNIDEMSTFTPVAAQTPNVFELHSSDCTLTNVIESCLPYTDSAIGLEDGQLQMMKYEPFV